MGFMDTLGSIGSAIGGAIGSAAKWVGNHQSTVGNIAKTATLALMLKEVTDSQKKESNVRSVNTSSNATAPEPDYGVREQIDPNTDTKIPVVYGEAFLGGNIIDAAMTEDNTTMYYALVLCERTGVKLSDGLQSEITFEELYWNTSRVRLNADGFTAASFETEEGDVDTSIAGLIEFYFYNNGSANPTNLKGYVNPGVLGNSAMLNWTNTHTMDELVFCVVKVTYSKENYVTGLGTLEFKLKNTMTQPGDCLNDYMINTRYGAGLPVEEINQ